MIKECHRSLKDQKRTLVAMHKEIKTKRVVQVSQSFDPIGWTPDEFGLCVLIMLFN